MKYYRIPLYYVCCRLVFDYGYISIYGSVYTLHIFIATARPEVTVKIEILENIVE